VIKHAALTSSGSSSPTVAPLAFTVATGRAPATEEAATTGTAATDAGAAPRFGRDGLLVPFAFEEELCTGGVIKATEAAGRT